MEHANWHRDVSNQIKGCQAAEFDHCLTGELGPTRLEHLE
jgi:hypothetical protein